MAFPTTPNVNDTHTEGNQTFRWSGDAWRLEPASAGGGVTASEAADIAKGSTLGLQQELLTNDGQPGLTVLAVGFVTASGKVQGVSLGDGNVVEVFASGADFNAGTVLHREFMSMGEPICFTGLANGAIITSTQGFYGMSEQVSGSNESPMPLLSYGLAFRRTFFFGFRNHSQGQGFVRVVNGPLANTIRIATGAGVTILGQENISLEPWEHVSLDTDGDQEYLLEGEQPMMACVHANMASNQFYDSRLIMPLTSDGITWPRQGRMSALYAGTSVEYWTRDNQQGTFTVDPGTPVNIESTTGANDTDYEPSGATRFKALGLVSAYSGADSAGVEATPMCPVSAMSQVVAQPFFIADLGDGGESGVSIASPYEGTAFVYSWNTGTDSLDLEYTVSLDRIGTTATRDDQNHPAAGMVANEPVSGAVTLSGQLNPGVVIADVPIVVIAQNADPGLTPTIRSQGGATTTGIVSDDDETLMLGVTPPTLRAEITEAADGLLYRRNLAGGGTESWVTV